MWYQVFTPVPMSPEAQSDRAVPPGFFLHVPSKSGIWTTLLCNWFRKSWIPPPPLPTPPVKVWIQVGNGIDTMHGLVIAFLNWLGQFPVVTAPSAVERSSHPTDPADPPPMSPFLSLQIGTIASLPVFVWASPRNGQGPCPG